MAKNLHMIKIALKLCETFKIITSSHYFVVEVVLLATNKDKVRVRLINDFVSISVSHCSKN
jgi:hypothetical protein